MDNNEKNLEYFKNLKYNIVVRKNKDKFILYIPELNLFEEDESFEKAYEKLKSEKEKYFQKMIEMEAQDAIVEPAYLGRKAIKKLLNRLIPFFIKLFVTVSIVVVLLATIDDISSTFKYIKRASKKFSRAVDMRQQSGGSLHNLNIEQMVFRALGAKEKYYNKKIVLDRLSRECEIITPAGVYDDNHFGVHRVENAFDHTDGSFWHTNGNKAYIVIDCKIPSRLQAFTITSRHDIPGLQNPDKTVIEGSNDKNNWKHVDEVPEIVCGQGETKVIFLENNKDYRYYKFNFSKRIETSYISIAELSLYSKKVVSAPANPSKQK